MRHFTRAWTLIPLIALVCALAGCGGGGGGGSTEPTVTFEPNYISSLESLNHWSRLPIKVYFDLPSGWTTSYPADLPKESAESWNQAGKQAFFSVVTSSSQADVTCSFVTSPLSEWEANTIAITRYSLDTSQHLMVPGTVSVICATHSKSGRALSSTTMRTSIAHELGHVLGLSGHSPNTDDLLYPIQQAGITSPQVRDFNTAMSAYSRYFTQTTSQFQQIETPNPAYVEQREIH
jgi:predicted Zn-dependent protease